MSVAQVRTLVVWCPDWPLTSSGIPDGVPAAVVLANRVIACSPAARERGVTRGLRRREAQGRCPEVEVIERDTAREARAFESVAAALEAFTPRVEMIRPGLCSFPTLGPSRCFGGDESLAQQVREMVDEVTGGVPGCRIGLADGPFAARLAARRCRDSQPYVVARGTSPAFLAPLPVTSLDAPALTDVLLRLGVGTLGAFAALGAADVAARFGTEGLGLHRLAAGRDERPPDTRVPPPDLEVSTGLDPPADRVDQVGFVAKALADRFNDELGRRGLACSRVLIVAETESGERMERLWRHEGSLGATAIAQRVRWQLEGWLTGGATPTGGIVRLLLVPDEVLPAAGRQLGFWGGHSEEGEGPRRALARVQGLLGPDSVRVPRRRGGRSPGEQVVLVPLDSVDLASPPPAGDSDQPWPGRLPSPSPVVIHPEPVPCEVLSRDGEPVGVSGRGLLTATPARVSIAGGRWLEVMAWAGPWTTDERWWDPVAHRRRARFQVLTSDDAGRLLSLEGRRWWEEAVYD